MSIQHVASVLDCRDTRMTGTRKLVLITLANRSDEKGKCWPSQDLIAGECGISVRAVSDHLKALEADGFITRKTQHLGKGNGSRTTYTLHLDELKVAPEDFADAEVAPASFVGCTGSTPRVTNLQEPTTNTLSARENEIDLAFDGYCTMARKREWAVPRELTPSRKASLRKRIKENTLPGWGELLRKCAASDFLCGLTDKPFTLTIDWLLKPSNILKVLEGNYDNRTSSNQSAGKRSQHRGSGSGQPDTFERLTARLEGASAGSDAFGSEDAGRSEEFTIDATAA
tara:strand:+ start:77 stop:931 length:855 start_codon:yes stop_codon:yes gene_type:complete